MPFANRPTRVLIQELADHSLCEHIDHSGPRLGLRGVIVIVRHGATV